MENDNGKSYYIAPDLDLSHHGASKGNPATNDWIPSADDQVTQNLGSLLCAVTYADAGFK